MSPFPTDQGWSSPTGGVVAGSALYFLAYDLVLGKELWVSDGTEDGTELLTDVILL